MTQGQLADRVRIERIWRSAYGFDERSTLAGSDKEWRFMEALLHAQKT